jgi:hypothetical protein
MRFGDIAVDSYFVLTSAQNGPVYQKIRPVTDPPTQRRNAIEFHTGTGSWMRDDADVMPREKPRRKPTKKT